MNEAQYSHIQLNICDQEKQINHYPVKLASKEIINNITDGALW